MRDLISYWNDCKIGTARWRPAQQPYETAIFPWGEQEGYDVREMMGEGAVCLVAGVKGVTVMEGIVRTSQLVLRGNKKN
jgi:hypothetical protein